MWARQTLMSGSDSAAPSTSPSRSAIQAQFSSRIGFSSLRVVADLVVLQRDEAPVALPGGVVDLEEAPELGLEVALAHVPHRDAVLARDLLRRPWIIGWKPPLSSTLSSRSSHM